MDITALKTHKMTWAVYPVLIGALMISFSGVWVKIAQVTPTVSAFYRVFFGGLILLPVALCRGERIWRGTRQLCLSIACGFLFALDLFFYHHSVHYIGPGLGTILPNFQVLILTIIGLVFLGEKVRWLFLAALPMAFIGLMMIVGVEWSGLGEQYRTGVLCGLAAAVCYAVFILTLRKLQADQKEASFFYVLMMVSLATSVFLGLEIWRTGQSFAIPDVTTLTVLLTLALCSQAVGWILIANALPRIRASLAGLILLLQPALAFLWDVLIFNRPTTLINWLGVAVALSAIYIGMSSKAPVETNKR